MKIHGIGTDIVNVDRIKKSLKNKKLLYRLFSKEEILKCNKLKLTPQILCKGYNKVNNQKIIERYYIIKKIV